MAEWTIDNTAQWTNDVWNTGFGEILSFSDNFAEASEIFKKESTPLLFYRLENDRLFIKTTR